MPCLLPFNNEKLDTSFFAFRPVGATVEDLIEALKWFSFSCEDQGCAYSSVFRSMHGSLIIWYGAWIKRSSDEQKMLTAYLLSSVSSLSHLAILVGYDFLEAYAGESKDGKGVSAAKFMTGDAISIAAIVPKLKDQMSELSYACLAVMRSCFLKMEGVAAGVCFRGVDKPMVSSLHVWKSLHSAYAWLLDSDHRKLVSPYISHLSAKVDYDLYRVEYVSSDDVLNVHRYSLPAKQSFGANNRGSGEGVA